MAKKPHVGKKVKPKGTAAASRKRLARLQSAKNRDAYPTADGGEIRFVRDKAAKKTQMHGDVGTPRKYKSSRTAKPTKIKSTKSKKRKR